MNHHQKIAITVLGKYQISADHLEKHFTHSHGHGGQNINKVATKVQIKAYLDHLNFPEELIQKLHEKFPKGHVEVECQKTRHQHQNLEIAINKLQQKIEEAILNN